MNDPRDLGNRSSRVSGAAAMPEDFYQNDPPAAGSKQLQLDVIRTWFCSASGASATREASSNGERRAGVSREIRVSLQIG